MHVLLVAALAVFSTSGAGVAAHCDCRTASSCPQAYYLGTATGCYLQGTRNVGVCCPANSSPAQVFSRGTFGTGNSRFSQSPAASFTSPSRATTQHSGTSAFRNPTHSSGFSRTSGTSGQGFSGQSGRLRVGQSGSSNVLGRPAQSSSLGQSSGFGQSSGRFTAPSSVSSTDSSYGVYQTPPSTTYGAPAAHDDCRPLVMCPPVVASPQSLYLNGCTLQDGSPGIICSFSGPRLASVGAASRSSTTMDGLRPMVSAQSFVEPALQLQASPAALQRAQAAGQRAFAVTTSASFQLVTTGQTAAADSPTELFNFNSQSTNEIQQLGLQALQSLETFTNLAVTGGGAAGAFVGSTVGDGLDGSAAQSFAQGNNIPEQGFANQESFQAGSLRPTGEGFQTTMDPTCTPDPPITCSNSLYRTVTGECNNLLNPRLGKARTGFKRLLPNTFDDGIFAIRTRAVRGGTLPTARFISERVLDVFSNELRQHTLSLMQIGQFADHDLTHALIFRLPNGAGIECCQNDGETFPPTLLHPQCIPIPIPANDPFYSRYRQRCMNLVRSLPAPAPDCVARPARPLNELTSFIDGSNVYGSSEEETRNLRAFQHGLLRESAHSLLPLDQRPDKPCRRNTCFHAGDTRVNEQSLLAVTHTVWMREHNRIARALQARHPRWGDERLYQEARRVLVAEWQHILYNEWLPVLIGFKYADDHGLLPLQAGYSNHYDHRIDPTISNSFATAAFRFGHTMVRDMYDILDANGIVVGSFNLSSTFFDPTVIAHGITDHARTMVAMRSETFDTFFARSLHEQLFTTNHLYGLDLLALNIQRGRDHGAPTYAQVAEACRLVPSIRFWGDLHALMDSTVIDRLRSVYDDPWDVDLFIGGVSERLAPGAQVGPTFQCLIGQQFFDLRYGDRFFYDNGAQPHSFSLPQLSQIRRASWARIMCDTLGPEFLNDFHHVQPLAVLTPGGQNQIVSCDSLAIPRVDLGVF